MVGPFDLYDFVKREEGFNPRAYWDHKQWSIGHGTRANGPNEFIDQAEADRRLRFEVDKAGSYVDQAFPNLDPNRRSALASFTYNLGPGWINSSRLGAAVRSGDWAGAAQIMQDYNRASGQPNAGLSARRKREADLLLGGEVPPPPPMALGGPKPMPTDPATGQWVPEEWIARRGRMADQMWGVQPSGGKFSALEGLFAGLGSGLGNLDVRNSLQGNQAMQQGAFRRAANAPDLPSMSRMLMGSGVPSAQRMGMETMVGDLQRTAAQNTPMARAQLRLTEAQARQAEEKEDPHKPYRVRAEVAKAYGLQPGTPEFTQFVLGTKTEPTQKFNVGDITKLTEEGGKYNSVANFAESFKDEFAGYGGETIGNAATWMGRYIPGTMGAASKESASFWQEYDKYKNKARNDMFGSALTATEQAAFERADINPGMDPKIVRKNLEIQKQALKSAAVKKANALIQAGYDPAPIAAAYGIDLKQLGVQTQRMKGATDIPAPKSSSPPAAAPAPTASDPLAEAREAISKGAPREKVIERLRERGIDPSGL